MLGEQISNGYEEREVAGKYDAELVGEWPAGIPEEIREGLEQVITWQIPHQAEWYPVPGRTLFLKSDTHSLKVKASGFYNPGDVSYSGTNRSLTVVPTGENPMPPIERLFERDLIHTDPSRQAPHMLESVPSIYAPIGGMTLPAAEHDQLMFTRLTDAGIPANEPLASYKYKHLKLNGGPMGVSVSVLPPEALYSTAFNLYLKNELGANPDTLAFLEEYSGIENFSFDDPEHRLAVLSQLARVAGGMLFDFSAKAGLYRFSGGPDNWNLKADVHEPLYLSDVDTSRELAEIAPEQQAWEVLRNLNSAVHNWLYYFLPVMTRQENGYTAELVQKHDFIGAMLEGFFPEKSIEEVKAASKGIWKALQPTLKAIEKEDVLGLRRGEYFLQKHCPRPQFHCMMLTKSADLIQKSRFQEAFPNSDTTPQGIRNYVYMSLSHESHVKMFPNFVPEEARRFMEEARENARTDSGF